jgi:16S rRNA (guanine966-N2)-methyltransferase
MRVIAGSAKGTKLHVPKGLDVRPTLDRVREALFSILGDRVPDARFLDLFAGTGANGIEALSRGASSAVFLDLDRRSLETIRANLASAKVEDRAEVSRAKLPADLKEGIVRKRFALIFADPPHAFKAFDELLAAIRQAGLLEPEGLIVVEHDKRNRPPEACADFERFREATYGNTVLSLFLDQTA